MSWPSRVVYRRRQRGVAVITALLLTTLAITIVASLFWQQQVQVRSIENQRVQLQKQWILRGALDWARLILREDARLTTIDDLGEPWAVNLAETRLDQYVENGQTDADVGSATLSGAIVDAQSRYNLKNLSVDGEVKPTEVAAFERLLRNLQLEPALARAAADMMAAAQTKPINPVAPAPAAVSVTTTSNRTMPLVEIDDLFALSGVKEETMRKLKDYIVILPRPTPVNVNTASAEVIAARIATISLQDARAIVASRERAYFRDTADFTQRFQSMNLASGASGIEFATAFFIVSGKVRMGRGTLEVEALIERNGSTSTRLISMREK